MGIRFLCPNGHKLNVKEFLAGKRGICPQCKTRFLVPLKSGGQADPLGELADDLSSGVAEPATQGELHQKSEVPVAGDEWHVRSASGIEQGPVAGIQIKRMICEGLINIDSWVWKPGWSDWQKANIVFPEIAATTN